MAPAGREVEALGTSMLVPLNDSVSSKGVVNFLIDMSICPDADITFVHIFRKPSSGEELMGKKFMAEQPARLEDMLKKAKERLIEEKGFDPEKIRIQLVDKQYPTITDGIIDVFNQGQYDMLVIGRKKMSKSEEFVLGDVSIKLIRALGQTAVLVVKSG
ncbi:MAG: universal stress protein [Desulfosalsimonas sp.]